MIIRALLDSELLADSKSVFRKMIELISFLKFQLCFKKWSQNPTVIHRVPSTFNLSKSNYQCQWDLVLQATSEQIIANKPLQLLRFLQSLGELFGSLRSNRITLQAEHLHIRCLRKSLRDFFDYSKMKSRIIGIYRPKKEKRL